MLRYDTLRYDMIRYNTMRASVVYDAIRHSNFPMLPIFPINSYLEASACNMLALSALVLESLVRAAFSANIDLASKSASSAS